MLCLIVHGQHVRGLTYTPPSVNLTNRNINYTLHVPDMTSYLLYFIYYFCTVFQYYIFLLSLTVKHFVTYDLEGCFINKSYLLSQEWHLALKTLHLNEVITRTLRAHSHFGPIYTSFQVSRIHIKSRLTNYHLHISKYICLCCPDYKLDCNPSAFPGLHANQCQPCSSPEGGGETPRAV